MKLTIRAILAGSCVAFLAISLAAQPQTKKERIEGQGTSKTEVLTGTVVVSEGGTLLVRMSSGDLREFNPPESRKFMIDGKEMTANELKPGTKLRASVVTTTTPVTERTTTVGSGKVWFVQGQTVILTLPNGENKMYKVKDSYKFNVNGQQATVHDLRKGMVVSAEKIVEEPKTEINTDIAVTGSAPPPPKPVVAEAPRTVETPAPAPAPAHTPAPARAAAPPPPPPAERAEAAPAPTKLPKTASPVPLVGLLGFLCTGASLSLRAIRRYW